MIASFNSKFDQIGFKKFLILSAAALFFSDLLNIFYLATDYLQVAVPNMVKLVIVSQGAKVSEFTPDVMEEMGQVLVQSMVAILSVFMLIHTVIYACLAKGMNWAKHYAGFYSICGVILTVVMLWSMVFQLHHYMWSFIMFLTTFIYAFIFLGLKHFKSA